MLTSDLSPNQKHNRIGKYIVNIFNEKIESELKNRKTKKSDSSTKEVNQKKSNEVNSKENEEEKPELTEEQKKELEAKQLEAIRKSLSNSKW